MKDAIREIISNNCRYFKDPITITEIGQQLASASRLTVDFGEVRVVLDQLKSDGVISEVKPGAFVPLCAKTTSGGIVMKSLLCAALCFSSLLIATAATVSDVTARQRYPWNGLVDLHFTITGDAGTKYDTSFTAKDMVGNTNIAMKTIRKADGTSAAAKEQLLPGTYTWIWDAAADLPKDFKCDRVTVTGTSDISAFPYSVKFNANGGTGTMADESFTYGTPKALTANAFKRTGYTFQGWATSTSGAKVYSDKQSVSNLATSSGEIVNLYAVWKAALYMVVNLSSGAVSYLDSDPSGGWTDNPYKQTRMAFRRIEDGTFSQTIGPKSKRTVTITKPFYISLHPLTLYHGYTLGCSAPGDHIVNYLNTYATWEKNTATVKFYDWQGANHSTLFAVIGTGENSLVSVINKKTKLSFSIPTEAQLTLARSSMNLGSTYVFTRDWFFSNLGNGSVTNPCQGQKYNGETTWHMSCISQTARAYVYNNNEGSFYDPSIGGATRASSVCVRLCIVVN